MTTITNYVKGNFLITEQQEQKQLCIFESEYYNESVCSQLFSHSLQLNLEAKERNLILIDFGLQWMSEFEKLDKQINLDSGKAVQIGENKYGLFFFDSLCTQKNDFAFSLKEESLKKVIECLGQIKKHLNGKPTILFMRGLEVLEMYYQKEDISLFVAELQQTNDLIKQVNLIVRKSLISNKLEEALTSLATCKIFFDYPYEQIKNEVHTQFFMLKLTLRKFNGYSFIQRYKFNLTEMKKNKLDIKKFDPKVEEDVPGPSEQDIQKMFQASFNLSISESQKKARQQLEEAIMPHLQQKKLEKWDNCAEKVKNKMDDLIELEGSDVDQEQEEDDDFDV
ncbi:hypothetical protein TTHERM_01109930 (macronuclear) [Tetrahymena thermophila SB210]|uniref:Uncharacterized protein n=1 Tax=Tetrahymena thermophila (strain SB210) TaxID=312017 RepID=Q22B62_TETTS|nr:hypothetical protein TTHERM_01109930 [Tetrahymena thermophila SB210]EAR82539.1 hypothetical protein TTHERM_01109930 [Tetrahymena thermophila SB210]|eukprot:XP_001030202.1 hypothetical protein TTHERM_01109930 [Tetrahymena thermophila SB210]